MNNSKVNRVTNRLTILLFIIYLVAICWILLFKLGVHFSYMGKRSVNLIPFNEHRILNGDNILNLIVFIPLGIYTDILFEKWTFFEKLLRCFLLSLIIEGTQYVMRIGAFDVTDIITNTLGALTGLVIFELVEKIFNHRLKAQKFINIIAMVGTVLMILLLALLKMSMLPIKYQ